MEEENFVPPSDAVVAKKNKFVPPSDAIVKKKVSTQPTAPKKQLESPTQQAPTPTSLDTEETQPPAVSDGLGGPPKMKTFTGFTPEEQQTLQAKPVKEKIEIVTTKNKSIQPKKETLEIVKDVIPKVAKTISLEKEDFSESAQRAIRESKILVDKKQIDKRISEVNTIQNEYVKSLNEINSLKKQLSNEKSEIDYQISIGNNTPEFKEKIAIHNKKVQDNLSNFDLLKDKSEIINYNKKVIESASGNLFRKKAEQGNWFGAIYNKMLEGASSLSAGAASLATDLIAEVIPSKYLISPKELQDLKDKGLDQNQINDYIKKSAKKEVVPIIRKSNVELIGAKGTTEEYIKKKQASSLLGGGVLGLAESAPAMLGGVYGRAANFFIMGSDAVNKEMESNPEFKDITENEKLAITVPIGIANAVLEEFGLQSVLKNNSLVNKLIHKTLLKVGADASANTFRRAMNNEIKDGLASGAFKVASGFTGEAITGGSQQAAEIGIKDIYNTIKDKKMFQTPETLSDAIYEISDAAIMEGIGGTIMSTLPAINEAIKNNDLGKKSTDFEFELLDNINENSEEFKKLFTADLKNKIIEGKIDKENAASQLDSFDKMISTFNKMPKDMSVNDKKKSFDLLSEKEKLNNEISGKDESLSVKQKERISEINSELANISLGKPTEVVSEEVKVIEPLKDVESTAKALENLPVEDRNIPLSPLDLENKGIITWKNDNPQSISEAYHKAKVEGGSPELVKAVEDLLISKVETTPTEVISQETSSNYANLTENKDGDFVFFHVGGKGYDKIKKSSGGTTATSKEEGAALSKVGGVAMYYTKPGDTETMVNGEAKYAVTIPKEKVYDANTDPKNYAEEAKTRHEEENPGKAFDANSKLAYITKIAGENGFDMVVSEWMGKTRAQTTTELTPTDVQLKEGDKIAKPFKEEYVDNTAKGLKSIVPESKEAKLKAVYDEINGIRNKQNKYDALYKLSSKDLTNVPQEETTKLIEESDLPQEVKDKYSEALAYEPGIRRTASIVGKEVEVKNAPEGHHLNIGLLEGRTDKVMSAEDVLSKLPKDIKAISYSEIEGTEPSISVEISRPLTTSEMNKFLEDTKQQAISQLSNKKGILYDVKRGTAEGWGEFDPSLFFTQDGNNLAEVKVTEVKQKESSVLKRIKEGGNAEYINEIIDKIGVNYAQRNQQQVISDAEAFVDEVGIEKAYEAIKNGSISNGDSVTVIYASIIDRIPKISENAIEDAKTESKKEAVQKEYNELLETVFDEFSKRQTDIGQATAILNALYIKNQEIMYSLSVQKEKYKAINAGVIDEDTLKKFEALDKRYSEANKKIKELESKLKEAIDEQNFKNIIEEQNRVTSKENIGSKVRNLAKDIRSGKKAILPSWAVAEGAKGAKGQGLTFEKTFAKALETFADVHDATKDFAKAIEEGIKVLKKWYASNNIDFNEGDIRNKFSDYVSPNIKKLTVVKGVIKIPSEIISNYVINVGSDINELSEQILKDSKEEYPNLTVRQIKDQISNYGSKLNKTRSQLAEDILRLKSLGRLESQLEDLKKGISNAKNEVKKRALSDLEKKYIAQIKAIKKNLGIEETERTKANENYVRRRIEELKEKIRNKDFSKKEVTPIKESEELKALKTEKNRVQEEYDKIVYTKELENRTIPEKISGFLSDMWDAQRVTRATGELSFVGAQGGFYMINSTFSRKTFNNLVKNFRGTSLSDWTKSPIKTISNIIKSATSAETIIEMFNKMGTKNNYDDYQSLLKAHPYYDVFVKSKLRILSEDIKTQVRDEMFIGNHFLHILKLPFTALTKFEKGKKRVTLQGYYEKLKTGEVSEKNVKTAEEIFEAVNPLGVFERGNNTFMNMARVEMFMDGVQALEIQGKNPTDHLDDYKKLASAVNTITGSGNLSQQISMALPKLNKLFFSPRFWAASLNMTPPISLYYLAKLGNYDNVTLGNPKSWGSIKPTVAQKAFVKPMLKGFIAFYGMSTLVVSLINAALDDDDEMTEEEKAKKRAYIEYDPRSSNFMQVISGDTKTDFFGPYRGNMVLFSRLFTGQTKKDGNIIENGAKWGSRTDFQIATEYIAGKANPFPGMFVRYSMGKKEEVLNEETNLKENRRMLFDERVGIDYQAKENLLPIFVGTIKAIQDEDPVLGSEFYTTLALFGKQTSVYKKKQKETTGRELSGNRSESGSRESSGTRSESGTRE